MGSREGIDSKARRSRGLIDLLTYVQATGAVRSRFYPMSIIDSKYIARNPRYGVASWTSSQPGRAKTKWSDSVHVNWWGVLD